MIDRGWMMERIKLWRFSYLVMKVVTLEQPSLM
jgi:hypothetical protein